jgi:hypothetical protein
VAAALERIVSVLRKNMNERAGGSLSDDPDGSGDEKGRGVVHVHKENDRCGWAS